MTKAKKENRRESINSLRKKNKKMHKPICNELIQEIQEIKKKKVDDMSQFDCTKTEHREGKTVKEEGSRCAELNGQ